MKVLVVIIVGVILFVIKACYDSWSLKKDIRRRIEKQWGSYSQEGMNESKRKTLMSFYESRKDENADIDEITWNDLDMETLYQRINTCFSALGEEYLYYVLHKPIISDQQLEERKRVMDCIAEDKDKRICLAKHLNHIGTLKNISFYEYIKNIGQAVIENNRIHILANLFLIVSVILICLNSYAGVAALFVTAGFNIITYYHCKAKLEKYYSVVSYVLRLLYCIRQIGKETLEGLSEYTEACSQMAKRFAKIERGSSFVFAGSDKNGSLSDILMDYIHMIFHFDLIKMNHMISQLKEQEEDFSAMMDTVGFLDAMYCLASYREYLGKDRYCEPTFCKERILKVQGLYHPLLENPVTSDLCTDVNILITGSNASGKSTFLKAVAMNAFFSQTCCISFTKEYKAARYRIFSSMSLADNLLKNESYFIVEIKALKRMIDRMGQPVPMLCFVDEVLRGTNTMERIAAAAEILYDISSKNALCFAATHDIELTYILESVYANYHFQERIEKNEIHFDYCLKQGRAMSRNAIELLRILGYSEQIVSSAKKRIQQYEKEAQWKSIDEEVD